MTSNLAPRKLTNAQAMLLELLNIDLSEQELDELRHVVIRHLRTKLGAEADQALDRRQLTTKQLKKEMSFSNRTDHLRAVREQKNKQ